MTSGDDAPPMSGDSSTRREDGWSARRIGGSATRRTMVIGIVAVLAIGTGAWWLAGGPDRQGVTRMSGAPDCPALVPQAPLQRDGLADNLVPIMPKFPVGPVGATVCRYPGMNSRTDGVVHGAELDEARTAEVAGWLDTEHDPARSPDACLGQDDGSRLVLTFRYPQGPPVRVTIRTSGCPASTNGVRREVTRHDVVARIERLVPAS
jgi:hypothetical protein